MCRIRNNTKKLPIGSHLLLPTVVVYDDTPLSLLHQLNKDQRLGFS